MKEIKLFGTDGIRSPSDSELLSPNSIKRLGFILGFLYQPKKVLIAQDTRHSGAEIASNIIAGLKNFAVECSSLGVLTSGAMSFITQRMGYDLGIMISASHNPYTDNGIKIFNKNGYKISLEEEKKIEELYFSPEYELYLSHIKNSFDVFDDIKNYTIIFDCANGAASPIIDNLFANYKNIKIINNNPTGFNINLNSGTEYLASLKNAVLENKADLGIAFDGDADRVVFMDQNGEAIEGDAILALMAIELKKQGQLKDNQIAATIMSSPSLDLALKPHGILINKTDIGDKNVSDFLAKNNYSFGGEQSGHIVLHDHCHCGDGIIAACYFLSIFFKYKIPASKLFNFYQKTPKLLKDITVNKKSPLESLPKTSIAIKEANNKLNGQGRVLFRYSGTEMKARLLVEAKEERECQMIADDILAIFNSEQNSSN